MSVFATRVAAELASARRGHQNIHSAHEGYAVILEELDELKHEVFLKESKRSDMLMLSELIQIAAMCQRFAEDLDLVPA